MTYSTQNSYGTDSCYSTSSSSVYTSSSLGSVPFKKKNLGSSRCCGRGCKPCVDDLGV